MGLTSPPQLDTRGIDVRLMSEESLLEAREEIRRTKEGFCQEDNGVKGIPFEMGCYLTPVSLLQVYFVISSRKSQGLYLCWTLFVQHLLSNQSSSPLNYKFFPPTLPDRPIEPCNEACGRRSPQPRTINLGQLGLIQDSLDTWGLGQVNIPVVSDNVVETYACS